MTGGWPDGGFPAAGLAAAPDEARAKLWDEFWAAHEAAVAGCARGRARRSRLRSSFFQLNREASER